MNDSEFLKRQNQFIKNYAYQIFQTLESCTKSFKLNDFSFIKSLKFEMQNSSNSLIEFLSNKNFLLICYSLIYCGQYSLFELILNERVIDCESLEKIACLNSSYEKFLILNDTLQKFSLSSTFSYSSESLTQLQYDFICKHIETFKILLKVDKILDYLSNTFALTMTQISAIKSEMTPNAKVEKLFHYLINSSADSFYRFAHGLLLTDQFCIFDIIHEIINIKRLEFFFEENIKILKENDENLNNSYMALFNQNVSCSLHLNEQNIYKFNNISDDDYCEDKIPKTDGLLVDLSVDMPDTTSASQLAYYTENKQEIYKNFTKPKGLALIIDNSKFVNLSNRNGTEVDRKNITNLLQQLGYKILPVYEDLTASEMYIQLVEFATHPEHKQMHSCIVVVLTHGEYDFITGVDGKQVNLHEFLACLNAKNAPNLAGKPKIFFLQACRGVNYDNGIERYVSLDGTDSCKSKINWKIKMSKQNKMNYNFTDYNNNKNKNNINENNNLSTTKSFQNFFSCIGLKLSNLNNTKNKSPKMSRNLTPPNKIESEESKQNQENYSSNYNQSLEAVSIRQRMPYLNLPYGKSGLTNLQQFFPLKESYAELAPCQESTLITSSKSQKYLLVREPTDADMLIAYATTPNNVSWRNTLNGTWFIQSICQIFSKYACNEDIITMLTRVNKQVAHAYQSSNGSAKQIPEVTTRLRRKFYFFPGITSE